MPYTNDILGHHDAPMISATDSDRAGFPNGARYTDVDDLYVFDSEGAENSAAATVPWDQVDNAIATPGSLGSLDPTGSDEPLSASTGFEMLL